MPGKCSKKMDQTAKLVCDFTSLCKDYHLEMLKAFKNVSHVGSGKLLGEFLFV